MRIGIVLRVLIILLIAGFIWVVRYKKQQQSAGFVLIYSVLVLLSGAISWGAIELLPIPTENVVVTALGERNEAAKNDEIYLTKVSVDGKEVELKTATDDRWFWQGDTYVWRNDSDIRRPDDLSEKFVLKLPMGTERYIEFYSNIYKGIAEIEYQGNVTTIDCYSEINSTVYATIESTSKSFLTIYAVVLAFILGVISCILLCTALVLYENRRYIYCILSTHIEEVVLAVILIVLAIVSFKYSVLQSFWGDEIHQLGFSSSQNTILDVISYSTTLSDINPPLYALILYVVRRFIPFGQQWLLTINIVLIIVGILFVYFPIGKMNRKLALLFALAIVMNPSIHNYGIYELRPYSLLFMLSCLTLNILIKRSEKKEYSSKTFILLTINCTLLCYTHMFGILLVFCLVVLDVFEMVKKRLSLKYFKTYIVCGFLFLPYATTTFLNLVSGRTYYKLQNPGTQTVDLRNIYFAIDFLSGSNLIYICLLVAGVAIAVSNKKSLKEDDDILRKAGCYSVILMLLIIGISFILSVLFKTSYMKERYFICLIPYSTFIITKAAKFIYNETAFLKKISLSALAFSIITAFFLNTNYLVKTEQLKVNQPFREVAEYLTSKADFYSSDVAIMVCGRDPMRFGWQYYLSKDFEYQDREILSWSNNKDKESLTKYKKIYIFYPYSISDGFKTFLNNLGFKQSDFNTSLRLLTYEKSK